MGLYTLKAVMHEIGDLKEGVTNEKEWKLRSFVVEETREWNEKTYSDFVEFTAFGNKIDGLAEVNIGDMVEVTFTISSRKRTSAAGKEYWGTSAKAVSLNVVTPVGKDPVLDEKQKSNLEPQDDDLPFN